MSFCARGSREEFRISLALANFKQASGACRPSPANSGAKDASVAGIFENGPAATEQGRQLFERLRPTLPIVLANLVTLGKVAVTYQNDPEQLIDSGPSACVVGLCRPGAHHDTIHRGLFLDFNLNINRPPRLTAGVLPPRRMLSPVFEDYPD
jgi:phospholipid/cholesterol/gamma-HCH transport system substrate-binding protein